MTKMITIQGIGAIAFILLAFSYFKKEKRQILLMQIFAYLLFAVHYYLLDGITGMICNIIGLIALITIYFFDKYKLKYKVPVSLIFVAIIIGVNIVTFQNIYSIFPMIASVIAISSFINNNEESIRCIGIVAAICWTVYGVVYKSYVTIVFQVITCTNATLAFFKYLTYDKKKK